MLEILIWAVCACLVALGFIAYLLGDKGGDGASLAGVLVLMACVGGAGFIAYQARQQAENFSSTLPTF